MLTSIIASKTARLITACVCPVVGAGTLTMAVPKARNAVHKATAPREYALPRTRERVAEPISAVAPCTTIGATPLSAGFTEDMPLPYSSSPGTDVPGTIFTPVSRGGPGTKEPIPGAPISGGPVSGAVPEPQTWLQLLIGFTLVGGAVRMARKRPTEDEEELLARVEVLKKDARR